MLDRPEQQRREVKPNVQPLSPPKKFIKLDPGKYKIEVRNTTFPPHTENHDLKARDEITVRHKFQ